MSIKSIASGLLTNTANSVVDEGLSTIKAVRYLIYFSVGLLLILAIIAIVIAGTTIF